MYSIMIFSKQEFIDRIEDFCSLNKAKNYEFDFDCLCMHACKAKHVRNSVSLNYDTCFFPYK